MNRLLLLALLGLFVIGCQSEADIKSQNPKLIAFIDEFKENHPTWNNNQITRDSINLLFESKIDEELRNNIISDYPIKLKGIKHLSKTDVYIGHFDGHHAVANPYIDILIPLPKSVVDTIKENRKYSVRVTKAERLKLLEAIGFLTDDMIYSTDVELTNSAAELGVVYMEMDSISMWFSR